MSCKLYSKSLRVCDDPCTTTIKQIISGSCGIKSTFDQIKFRRYMIAEDRF